MWDTCTHHFEQQRFDRVDSGGHVRSRFTAWIGVQKPLKPSTDISSTIIFLHLRLTQEGSCKKIPGTSDDGLGPSLLHSVCQSSPPPSSAHPSPRGWTLVYNDVSRLCCDSDLSDGIHCMKYECLARNTVFGGEGKGGWGDKGSVIIDCRLLIFQKE